MPESDYLILGGGTAGVVLASRLKEYLPAAKVTLVEAGPDETDNPMLTEPMATLSLHGSKFQYNYKTTPQKHYGGREVFYAGGRVLSGSSSVNYATWSRGDRADYDLWGSTVQDPRWSYDGLLPYFRKTECHHEPKSQTSSAHGYEGNIHTKPALDRRYPLTNQLKQAYLDIGVQPNEDGNSGDNKGLAPHVENWRDGKRQAAAKAYGLKGVDLRTNATVRRVITTTDGSGLRATGAELASGEVLQAKEVILACGAIRSPQVLLLSGIGPAAELQKHGIKQVLESPQVGQNLHEHCPITQFFRVRNAEKGVCAPHASFNHPTYGQGFPCDYEVTESVPSDILSKALRADGEDTSNHPYLCPPRSHYLLLPMYAPTEAPLLGLGIPVDGSVLSVGVINVLPTSRGSITLASTDPSADPLIDPNYYATETDRAILRSAICRNLSAFETESGRLIVESEMAPEGFPALTSKSSNAEIDERVRRTGSVFFHSGGTAAMGRVVDAECRVRGVQGLRVVDASVMPVPVSAAYQVPVYALAEQMADIIAGRV